MKFVLALVALTFAGADLALADSTVWQGQGQLYDAQRAPLSTYNVQVNIDSVSATSELRRVSVTNAQGVVLYQDSCTVDKDGNRWRTVCSHSNGGGYYFDHGLAQEYVTGDSGADYVTQIVIDSPTAMRLMRTELRAGAATKFFVETLAKIPQ